MQTRRSNNFGAAARYAARLATNPLALCQYLFRNGRIEGDEFVVGNIDDKPGRSLRVKLSGPKAGKWQDFHPRGQLHGDLLNLIYFRKHCRSFAEAMREADLFLGSPPPTNVNPATASAERQTPDTSAAALRLWRQRRPIARTPAAMYFRRRGFTPPSFDAYGYIPRLRERSTGLSFPALLYRVTNGAGTFVGIHRLFLQPNGRPADVPDPKQALGPVLGGAIWHSRVQPVVILAEGGEDGLALFTALPRASIASALSASQYADVSPAFEAVAQRREAKARQAEAEGAKATARENYFMAAIHWAAAQWPIDEADAQNRRYNERKRDCYGRYAVLADHRVEAVWIPFQGKALPAWLHLPPGHRPGERVAAVVAVPGMDSFKEMSVSLYGDRWLTRGMAVLAVDGPGQYECPLLDIFVSIPAWDAAGPAIMDWLTARPEIDPARIGIAGASFGSLFATIAAAAEPRYRACAVTHTCLEPGCRTIFEEASPTFKKRFMYMADIADEAAFDEFRGTLTWEGHAEKIRAPYLCLAGEADELSPMSGTEALIAALNGPKRLVVYQDARHSVGGVAATNHGPYPPTLMADWMAACLDGASFPSERWYVDAAGRVAKAPL